MNLGDDLKEIDATVSDFDSDVITLTPKFGSGDGGGGDSDGDGGSDGGGSDGGGNSDGDSDGDSGGGGGGGGGDGDGDDDGDDDGDGADDEDENDDNDDNGDNADGQGDGNEDDDGSEDGSEGEADGGGEDGDECDDIDDATRFKKFNNALRNNYVTEIHPESASHNDDEIHSLAHVVRDQSGTIIDPLHRTIPILTKYEKTRILGVRTKQINEGAPPYISVKSTIIDGYIIAMRELEEKKIPFIVRRPLPNGGSEYWYLQDLEII